MDRRTFLVASALGVGCPTLGGSAWREMGGPAENTFLARRQRCPHVKGVARWQALEFDLPRPAQLTFAMLAVAGPVVTAAAMLSVNFHWPTDALIGGGGWPSATRTGAPAGRRRAPPTAGRALVPPVTLTGTLRPGDAPRTTPSTRAASRLPATGGVRRVHHQSMVA